MNGPSVTPVDRTVLAVFAGWSWCPPSSLPVAPHFSYQAPTSVNQAPNSGVFGAGSAGVSRISITYFTRVSLVLAVPVPGTLSLHSTNGTYPDPTGAAGDSRDIRLAVADPPDQAHAGPVLVDGGDLDVDESQLKRVPAEDVVGDVAVVPGGAPRPGCPEHPCGEDAPGQGGQPAGYLDLGAEERHDQVRRTVRAGSIQAGGRVLKAPAPRRVVERDPLSGLQAQLARLRRA